MAIKSNPLRARLLAGKVQIGTYTPEIAHKAAEAACYAPTGMRGMAGMSPGACGTPRQAAVVDEYRERLIAAAKPRGKGVAMLVDSVEQGQRWIKAGVDLLVYSSDVGVMHAAYSAAVRQLRP